MHVPSRRGHLEVEINERGRLTNLPVDTRAILVRWDSGHIDDKVANGPEEVLGKRLKEDTHK